MEFDGDFAPPPHHLYGIVTPAQLSPLSVMLNPTEVEWSQLVPMAALYPVNILAFFYFPFVGTFGSGLFDSSLWNAGEGVMFVSGF